MDFNLNNVYAINHNLSVHLSNLKRGAIDEKGLYFL